MICAAFVRLAPSMVLLGAMAGVAGCGSDAGGGSGAVPDGGGSSSTGEPDAPPVFPTGVYSCSSSLSASGSFQGTNFESVGGGNGTLTLTQSAWTVDAAYAGDTFVQGSLRFTVTTDASAVPAAPGQTVTIDCFVPFGSGPATELPLTVASGALTMDGSTIFLSFSGKAEPAATGPSACDGLAIPVTLTCTAQQ